MRKNIFTYLSYGTLIAGIAVGLYAMVNTYLIKSSLPAGVCPITDNRPLLYTAITLCGVSFILSFFEPRTKKIPR